MSAYTYATQTDGTGGQGCADFREGTSYYITHDRADTWKGFKWTKVIHYEGIEMSAGEVLKV